MLPPQCGTPWTSGLRGPRDQSFGSLKHLHRLRIQPRGCRFLKSCQWLVRQRTVPGQNKQKLFFFFNFFFILKVYLTLLSTPFSACDVKGRGRAATSRTGDVAGGTRFRGFLPVPGPRSGGPGSPCSFGCGGVHEAPLSSRDSAVKAALEPEPLLFPQNGGSPTIFQNLPQSAQAPRQSAAGIYLAGFAATVQSTDFHWLKS